MLRAILSTNFVSITIEFFTNIRLFLKINVKQNNKQQEKTDFFIKRLCYTMAVPLKNLLFSKCN